MKPANGGVLRRSFLQGTLSAGAAGLLAQTKKAKAQQSAPVVQKTVYAWYPGRFGTWNTSSIQWDALTHICFRSVVLQADGSIARPAGSPPQAFLDEARSHGVKVCILAWANNRNDSDGYLADNPDRAVENLLAYVRENGLDGISYDDEMIGRTNSRTGGPSQPLVSAFFQKLYEAFKSASSSYHISYASPPVISAKAVSGSITSTGRPSLRAWMRSSRCCTPRIRRRSGGRRWRSRSPGAKTVDRPCRAMS